MTELTNKVEIAGELSNIRKTDNNSIFAQINQDFTGNDGNPHKRFFRFYIRNTIESKFSSLLQEGRKVTIQGKLDVFKSKFGPTLMIDVENVVALN